MTKSHDRSDFLGLILDATRYGTTPERLWEAREGKSSYALDILKGASVYKKYCTKLSSTGAHIYIRPCLTKAEPVSHCAADHRPTASGLYSLSCRSQTYSIQFTCCHWGSLKTYTDTLQDLYSPCCHSGFSPTLQSVQYTERPLPADTGFQVTLC